MQHWRWIPNGLSFLRMLLVIPFAWALASGRYREALILFVVAAATDGLDGFLARFFGWKSRLGAILDPLADKLLMVTTYLVLSITGVFPLWLFMLVLGRDVVIVVGGLLFHRFVGRFEVEPSAFGKLNTLVQILAALAVMLHQAGFELTTWTQPAALWAVTVMALISGGHYVTVWGLRALRGGVS
ncbi:MULTISPECIES: CDP-alcohol phosphatidyltransferase family protein [Marinobacter]|uniref:CDP-alcohol phosphatidyltransferase family protein n=1 Tax=Marinobacter TaxID=2742 RepID=UPI00223075A2|nr:CDP-alcohol phosphatidyltransferase family protein [Marinobacter sp. AN1]UZD64339.1 CDP-alcohol phosphatidyltransferase family protein [Marinobacter sp. AN1]